MKQNERIASGFHAFTAGGTEEFGAVRRVAADGKSVTVYIENGGEFEIDADAVMSVGSQKVVFDDRRLAEDVREAIAHAHDAEIANDAAIES
jgi:hypothetical protein